MHNTLYASKQEGWHRQQTSQMSFTRILFHHPISFEQAFDVEPD
jgi:hypothetical protein